MSNLNCEETFQTLALLVGELPLAHRALYVRKILHSTALGTADLVECVRELVGADFSFRFDSAARSRDEYRRAEVTVLAIGQELYPLPLSHIYDPPLYLFVQGELNRKFVDRTKVAVVGSRRSNREGEDIAHLFSKALAESGICVVSGLALGIDSAAHKGALESSSSGLQTIGILGSGFNKFYPPYNRELKDKILNVGGLIISQFPPECPALPSKFS